MPARKEAPKNTGRKSATAKVLKKVARNIEAFEVFEKDVVSRKYSIEACIGSGTYGKVFRAVCNRSRETVAIKQMKTRDQATEESLRCEIGMLKIVGDGEHVCKLHEVIETQGNLYVVLQYMRFSLAELMKRVQLDEEQVLTIAHRLLKSLQHIHDNKIVHLDVKPENILIGENGEVCLCDFGMSMKLKEGINAIIEKNPDYEYVTVGYRSPELIMRTSRFDSSADMWSAGCVIAEMITGAPLFHETQERRVLIDICELASVAKEWPQITRTRCYPKYADILSSSPTSSLKKKVSASKDMIHLLSCLLHPNPKSRITAEQALQLDIFKHLRS